MNQQIKQNGMCFSRLLNERKCKLQSAYVEKVISGILASLVITEAGPAAANPNGVFDEYQKMLEESQAAFEKYMKTLEIPQKNVTGDDQAESVYIRLEETYHSLVEAHLRTTEACKNAEKSLEAEVREYRNAVKVYKSAKAAYDAVQKNNRESNEPAKKSNAPMDDYRKELADYAEELSFYGRQLTEYRKAQETGEAMLAMYSEMMAELAIERTKNAPASVLLNKLSELSTQNQANQKNIYYIKANI